MSSQINTSNPTAGTATTASVRENFTFCNEEITQLQRSTIDIQDTGAGQTIGYSVAFPNAPTFTLADGVRITIRIIEANTTTAPVLTVTPVPIPVGFRKSDGSTLDIGDLAAGGIYDLIYNLTLDKWIVLNLDILTSQDRILTTVLGGIYPVDSLLTTTRVGNPGDPDYFFSGITFGTWAPYAEGRVLVGIDSTDSSFDTIGETGGTKEVTLNNNQIHHNHQWHASHGGGSHRIELNGATPGRGSYNSVGSDDNFENAATLSGNYYTNINRTAVSEARTAVNNLQPYIVTYIWKRTA
ncbi:hypothetical protein N9074_01350 [Akkermansiaceae bacterium]|nr:hypothetical protein [Akkermansiaceae bacterium]